jgi:integrase
MVPKSGKHPEKALSPVKLRNHMEPGRYADGNGLYLVVEPSGSKRWVLRTVIKGKRCDIGLGSLGLVPLAEAREEAGRLRKIARAGGDPLAIRREARKTIPTFETVAKQVHEAHAPSWKNPKHAAQWLTTLTEYTFPEFGTRRVDAVQTNDVKAALLDIWLSKPETARRVRQRIHMVFEWCKASGWVTANPCDGLGKVLPKQPAKQEHHAALPYPKAPAFITSLRAAEDVGEPVKLAFELLILTATRTNEVLAAKPGEFDLEAGIWTIPADRMKAKRDHRVPLAPQSVDLVKQALKLNGDGTYLFPGRDLKKPLSNMAFLMALRRMNVDTTAHGFRSSFRDWAAERTNFPREVCEAALAHTLKDKTEAAYNRTDLFDKRRELMATWAAFATATQAEVVQLRAATA